MKPCAFVIHGDAFGCDCRTWCAMGDPVEAILAYTRHRLYRDRSAIANSSPPPSRLRHPVPVGEEFGATGGFARVDSPPVRSTP